MKTRFSSSDIYCVHISIVMSVFNFIGYTIKCSIFMTNQCGGFILMSGNGNFMYISCKINHKFGTNIRYKNSGNLIWQPSSIKLPYAYGDEYSRLRLLEPPVNWIKKFDRIYKTEITVRFVIFSVKRNLLQFAYRSYLLYTCISCVKL